MDPQTVFLWVQWFQLISYVCSAFFWFMLSELYFLSSQFEVLSFTLFAKYYCCLYYYNLRVDPKQFSLISKVPIDFVCVLRSSGFCFPSWALQCLATQGVAATKQTNIFIIYNVFELKSAACITKRFELNRAKCTYIYIYCF